MRTYGPGRSPVSRTSPFSETTPFLFVPNNHCRRPQTGNICQKLSKQRSTESRRLIDLIFREYKSYEFFKQGQTVDQANVWLGTAPQVDLVLDAPLKMVLSRKDRQAMEISLQWLDPVPAPIRAGDQIVLTSSAVIKRLGKK